jgi:hypothetical protein
MCISHASFGDLRNDVFAEIVAGVLVAIVFFQQLIKIGGVKDINAHAGQRFGRVGRHRRRVGGFLDKLNDFSFSSTAMTPKADASSMGTGMQATVQRAPFSTWSISMRE